MQQIVEKKKRKADEKMGKGDPKPCRVMWFSRVVCLRGVFPHVYETGIGQHRVNILIIHKNNSYFPWHGNWSCIDTVEVEVETDQVDNLGTAQLIIIIFILYR